MACDAAQAERIRRILRRRRGFTERRMFGGLCFLLDGHMCCGLIGDRLVLRLGDAGAAAALARSHARPMDFTGRPMKSMVYVERDGYATARALRGWLDRAVKFVRTQGKRGRPRRTPSPRTART